MPKKPITWIGAIIILAAGLFCCWALFQYRNEMTAAGMQSHLLTAAVYIAPVVAVLAIFLWYYFNEKI
ncbi:hypothetical protein ACFLV8_02515 [Chloroflexota bacterium]